jgi:sulfur-oxidizing protein SoxZ
MSALATPRIRIPRSARAGEAVEIRTLIEHPMETGLRRDSSGKLLPRDMLKTFTVRMNGDEILGADLRNGTSANPYHVFFVRVARTSRFDFEWADERGQVARATAQVTVG